MKNLMKITVAVFITSLFLGSCKKDDDSGTTINGVKGSEALEILFSKSIPQAQTFTVDVTTISTLAGTEGTTIIIPANSIVDADGIEITGNVEAKLTEYRSKGGMAASGVTTVSGNNMLESAGMFNLEVTKDGAEVFLKQDSAINVRIDQDELPTNQFILFKGEEKGNPNDQNLVDWVVEDSVPLKPQEDNRTSFFTFDYFQFGYCNIDRFYADFIGNEVSSFEIQVPAGMDGENTWALLMFKDFLSCAWTYWSDTDDVFKTHYALGKGVECKVLVVHVIDADNKEFEYALEEVTLIENTVVVPTNFTSASETQISDIVENL